MNNFLYPIPPMINNYNNDLIYEIMKLKEKITELENRINSIEKNNNKQNNYLKKDDNYYIV